MSPTMCLGLCVDLGAVAMSCTC